MSETKHTPAPWSIDVFDQYDKSVTVGTSEGWLADVQLENLPTGQGAANARLIAAAPELLEACRVALEALNEHGDQHTFTIHLIESTIAKAKGESK